MGGKAEPKTQENGQKGEQEGESGADLTLPDNQIAIGEETFEVDPKVKALMFDYAQSFGAEREKIEALREGLAERGFNEPGLPVEIALQALDTRTEELQKLGETVDRLRSERDKAVRSLSAQKGATTKAKNAIEELEARDRPRALPMPKEPMDARELAFRLADLGSAPVEIAFTDGRKELRGIGSRQISASNFRLKSGRVILSDIDKLHVHVPMDGTGARSLGAIVLLEGDEVIAGRKLSSARQLGEGKTYDFVGDIVFG